MPHYNDPSHDPLHDPSTGKSVSTLNAFLFGVCGAGIMTFLLFIARRHGIPGMDLAMTYGTLFIQEPGSAAWWLGFFIHLAISGAIALLYVSGFDHYHRTGFEVGALFGAVHWFIGGFIMALMPVIHPTQPERIFAPGFFAINSGVAGVFTVFAVHIVYGAVVGFLHKAAVQPQLQPERALLS